MLRNMAFGRYSRVDGRKSSSSYCSTVALVVFVALCLVGVWMMTSTSVVPGENVEVASHESRNDVEERVSESYERNPSNENNESNPKQFEDSPGDLPEDATKGDTNVSSAQEEDNNSQDKTTDTTTDGNQEEKPETKPVNENAEETESDDAHKTETQNGVGDSNKEDSDSEAGETKTENNDDKSDSQGDSEEGGEKKSDENSGETQNGEQVDGQIEEKVEQNEDKESDQSSGSKKEDGQAKGLALGEVFPSGAQSELLNETTTQSGAWSTQATESKNEKEAQNQQAGYNWKLCNVTAGPDYIQCLDNWKAIRSLHSTKHYEHRERHCPEDPPTCLVPLPEGYQRSIEWPTSREKVYGFDSKCMFTQPCFPL